MERVIPQEALKYMFKLKKLILNYEIYSNINWMKWKPPQYHDPL